MKAAIVLLVLGFYLVVAFVIARFCAVNAGWEKLSNLLPSSGGGGIIEPEEKNFATDSPDFPRGGAAPNR